MKMVISGVLVWETATGRSFHTGGGSVAHRNQQAEELAGEAGEAVNVAAGVQRRQDEDHPGGPEQRHRAERVEWDVVVVANLVPEGPKSPATTNISLANRPASERVKGELIFLRGDKSLPPTSPPRYPVTPPHRINRAHNKISCSKISKRAVGQYMRVSPAYGGAPRWTRCLRAATRNLCDFFRASPSQEYMKW